MSFDKDKMIDKLLEAKDLVIEVYDITDIHEVVSAMCEIDEAIGAIEDSK